MSVTTRIAARVEDLLCRSGLMRTATWQDALSPDVVRLYAGDLPRNYPQYAAFWGITPFRAAPRNISHDLIDPMPIPDNSVDIFQAEDVFEHIEPEHLPALIDEIHRVLKSGGLFRLSVPDYNCCLYSSRSVKDETGKIVFDPWGGGSYQDGKVGGGGHVWFPTISAIRQLLAGSPFEDVQYLQYYQEDGEPVNCPVDHGLAPVRRSAELDERQGIHPVSIIVDARKSSKSLSSANKSIKRESSTVRGSAQLPDRNTPQHRSLGKGRVLKEMVIDVARGLTPPYIAKQVSTLLHRERDASLFGGETTLFEKHLARAKAYGEYGCGMSTIWVATKTALPIYSVDTSLFWIDQVRGDLGHRPDLNIVHVDLGPLADWGRPVNYERRDAIRDYTEGVWRGDAKPDVVLVDGRFRVACFFASLLHAEPGSTILFDDYNDRHHYHVVEEFARPTERCGRQAAFEVPESLPRDAIRDEYEKFLYVMD